MAFLMSFLKSLEYVSIFWVAGQVFQTLRIGLQIAMPLCTATHVEAADVFAAFGLHALGLSQMLCGCAGMSHRTAVAGLRQSPPSPAKSVHTHNIPAPRSP